jgi:hypothetical protein
MRDILGGGSSMGSTGAIAGSGSGNSGMGVAQGEMANNELWAYVRQLESRFSRMQEEYELRISRMQEEIFGLKQQIGGSLGGGGGGSYSSEMGGQQRY